MEAAQPNKRTREESESVPGADTDKETEAEVDGQVHKKTKTGDTDEKKKAEVGRERFRRTCWVPEVVPRSEPRGEGGSEDVSEGEEEDGDDEAKQAAVEALHFKFDHKNDLTCFGGVRPWLRKDEEWPRCGDKDCERLLQFFLQLDFRFLPEEARAKFAGEDVNRMLQLFFCYACEESYEPFAPSVLVRLVPLPPAVVSPGQELSPALLADIAANEDAAVQLSKRPHDDEQRSESECKFPKGHFPFKKLVNWAPHEDWPNLFERRDIAAAEGIDPANDLPTPVGGCKLGGWADWIQDVDQPPCTKCGEGMSNVVFNVAQDGVIPYDFDDNGTGQIVQCPTHHDVLAFPWSV